MTINEIFREMFNEHKREKELKFQQEIIRKTLENQANSISDFDMGLELLEDEDYENAIIYLTRCANNDNSQAQYELGILFKEGLGTDKDIVKAKEYLMKSYKNGFKRAGFPLRELRYEENKQLNKDIDIEFENKISELGFTIDIPKN